MTIASSPTRQQQFRLPTASCDQNTCLSELPAEALALLTPHLSRKNLVCNTVLWDVGEPTEHVYFPISGLISIVLPMSTGEAVEVTSISRQGTADSFLDARAEEPVTRGVVQIGGVFAQIDATRLRNIAAQNLFIERMLDLCRDWMTAQAQQIAACNAIHPAPKRLCRWLAHNTQKMGTRTLQVTQDTLGSLLGIRRTTVTLISQGLHAQGLIEHSRGMIQITAPERLEGAACECCHMLDRSHWPATRLASLCQQ